MPSIFFYAAAVSHRKTASQCCLCGSLKTIKDSKTLCKVPFEYTVIAALTGLAQGIYGHCFLPVASLLLFPSAFGTRGLAPARGATGHLLLFLDGVP